MKRTHFKMYGRGDRMACGRVGTTFYHKVTVSEFRATHVNSRCAQCERVLAGIVGEGFLAPPGKAGAP